MRSVFSLAEAALVIVFVILLERYKLYCLNKSSVLYSNYGDTFVTWRETLEAKAETEETLYSQEKVTKMMGNSIVIRYCDF